MGNKIIIGKMFGEREVYLQGENHVILFIPSSKTNELNIKS